MWARELVRAVAWHVLPDGVLGQVVELIRRSRPTWLVEVCGDPRTVGF